MQLDPATHDPPREGWRSSHITDLEHHHAHLSILCAHGDPPVACVGDDRPARGPVPHSVSWSRRLSHLVARRKVVMSIVCDLTHSFAVFVAINSASSASPTPGAGVGTGTHPRRDAMRTCGSCCSWGCRRTPRWCSSATLRVLVRCAAFMQPACELTSFRKQIHRTLAHHPPHEPRLTWRPMLGRTPASPQLGPLATMRPRRNGTTLLPLSLRSPQPSMTGELGCPTLGRRLLCGTLGRQIPLTKRCTAVCNGKAKASTYTLSPTGKKILGGPRRGEHLLHVTKRIG